MTKIEALKVAVKIRGYLYDLSHGRRLTRIERQELDSDLAGLLIKLRELPDDEVTA